MLIPPGLCREIFQTNNGPPLRRTSLSDHTALTGNGKAGDQRATGLGCLVRLQSLTWQKKSPLTLAGKAVA
jgi:hypothetical protein